MSQRIQPIARTGRPFSGQSLCGSDSLWFDQAMQRQRGGEVQTVDLADLDDAAIQRLSAPRPTLCGLTLDQPRLMGILNVTPDSFSDGGELDTIEAAVTRARQMAGDTDILDIGGESTRPGAEEVAIQEEIQRTAPVIEAIRAAGVTTPISIDTRKARVAEAALDAGADIVNDVSAFSFDPELVDLVAERDVPVCLMHSQGRPEDMQNDPRYDDVLFEVMDYLEERISFAEGKGIKRERIITDPGIGFGKTLEHNVTLLRNLSLLHDLGLPVLLGVSRKRFIGTIGQAEVARDRVAGSVAVAMHGIAQGMQILRVHDTFETRQALRLHAAMTEKK